MSGQGKKIYTPGPWKIEQHGDEFGVWGHAWDGLIEGRVLSIIKGVVPTNSDARLIAAAPALLEALTQAADQLGAHYGNGEPLVQDCRAAIALATGAK